MNKQELKEAIEKLPQHIVGPLIALISMEYVSVWSVLDLIDQLDEPQKVVVPKFYADWIEERKKCGNSLIEAIESLYDTSFPEDCEWLTNNSDLFARAWLDGYEVEDKR